MANTASAKRALRRQQRRRARNLRVKRAFKSAIREFRRNPSSKLLTDVYSKLDIAAKKGVIHTNKAARLKSRLARLLEKSS